MPKRSSKYRLTAMALSVIGLCSPAVSSADPGTLQFSVATFTTLDESDAEIAVTRTGGSDGAVSVQCSTIAGGTATPVDDYTEVNLTLEWADQDNEPKFCIVPINDDNINTEITETVNLELSNPTGATLGNPKTATLEITEDCGPGEHWIDSDDNGDPCPAGTDRLPHTRADITIEIPCGNKPGISLSLRGPAEIERKRGTMAAPTPPPEIPDSAPPLGNHHINTEIVSMNLTGNGFTLRAGVNEGLSQPSLGQIIELANDATQAYSFFKLFFEIDLPNSMGGGTLYNKDSDSHDLELIITKVPPLSSELAYQPPSVIITPLFDNLDKDDNPVACLVESKHITLVTLLDNSFTATPNNGTVTIAWETASEIDNAGIFVWRGQLKAGKTECSLNGDDYTEVKRISPFISAQGSGAYYSYQDTQVESGNTYCYALEDVDFYGTSTFHLDDIPSATVQ